MQKLTIFGGTIWQIILAGGAGWVALVLFLAPAFGQGVNQVTALSPTSAVQGANALSVTFTLDSDVPLAPPATILPTRVTIGGISGGAVAHPSQYSVTAVFDIPSSEAAGAKGVAVVFQGPSGPITFTNAAGFSVAVLPPTPPSISQHPQARIVLPGASALFSVSAAGSWPLAYQWQKDGSNLSAGTNAAYALPAAGEDDAGAYRCIVTNAYGAVTSAVANLLVTDGLASEGYNLYAPTASTNTYLMDNAGIIVHAWASAWPPGQAVYFQEDGTLWRTANTDSGAFVAGGAGGRVEQMDWNGALRWAFDYSSTQVRLHHDIEVLPNGNVLMIAWELKEGSVALAAGRNPAKLSDGVLWPDHIIEVAPTGTYGGDIVWEWHVWDHLVQDYCATQANYGTVADHPELIDINYTQGGGAADWNHMNSIDYNAELDQIMVSVRAFSEIWVIDHGTTTAEAAGHTGGARGRGGDLLYRWGNPRTYERGGAGDQLLFAQHDAEWISSGLSGAGHVLVFNNGQGRPGGNYSSIEEILPPLAADGSYGLADAAAYGPTSTVWTYQDTPPTNFYASHISGSQRLPNGNTLICDGPAGHFFEVTPTGDLVWEYTYGGDVFRVERYPLAYPGFEGTPLNDIQGYPITDTAQVICYGNTNALEAPGPGSSFAGQDAQYQGLQPQYTLGADAQTVYDHHTGLTWTRSPDLNGDGIINALDKLSFSNAGAYATNLQAQRVGGFGDWRLPTIKELYSLMSFAGLDVSGVSPILLPFIDTNYFAFGYGDTNAGERLIDAQFASTTIYLDTVMQGQQAMFGLNLADGRIKGYPLTGKNYYVYYVRGNTHYGTNAFIANGDGTITDQATGLIWQQADSGIGLHWEDALRYAENLSLAGYQDWRLPNAKELQSLVDYSRAPGITASAALDPVFQCTAITNEAGVLDYPWFWTSTTHANGSVAPGKQAVYVCFGRALGYMNGSWQDVHGAGAQRSDPKSGSLSEWTYAPDGYYSSQAPQGDAIRLFNFVRCVRGGQAIAPTNDTDADGLTDWYEYRYTTNTTGMSATADQDGDGFWNLPECGAGTSPIDAASYLGLELYSAPGSEELELAWSSVWGKQYIIEACTNLAMGCFTPVAIEAVAATPPMNIATNIAADAAATAYRIIIAE